MSGTKRLLFIGMVWSVLVVVTLFVFLAEAPLLPVVFAFVAVLAGWVIAAGFKGDSANNPLVQVSVSQFGLEVIEQSSNAIVSLAAEVSTQIHEMWGVVLLSLLTNCVTCPGGPIISESRYASRSQSFGSVLNCFHRN